MKKFIMCTPNHRNIDFTIMGLIKGKSIVVFTFAASLSTTLAIIWILFKLGFSGVTMEGPFNIKIARERILLGRNLITDTLIPDGELVISDILANQLSVSSGSHLKSEMHVDQDRVVMQAKSFGLGKNENLAFEMPNRVDVIELENGLGDVKLIKAPDSKSKLGSHRRSDLQIDSTKILEFSGNMGLHSYSKELYINSPESINIECRQGPITIESSRGIYLPSIERLQNESSEIYGEQHIKYHNICIDRSSGIIIMCPKG